MVTIKDKVVQVSPAPHCVGIIMDGNRRFAKERGLPTFEGHRRGYLKLKDAMEWVREHTISHLVVYAFSTENWSRTKGEVSYLMDLFRMIFQNELAGFQKEGFRIRCIGERERFSPDIQELMGRAEARTSRGTGPTLVLALSYGGRREILAAANAAIAEGERNLTEESFRRYLWSNDIPDPDLIIRTGGEMRLSGFLTWQSVYSELFFTATYWPEFSKEEFDSILKAYAVRERRMGR